MRTVEDWIHAAGATSDPVERDRRLEAATARAESVFDWLQLLRALSDPPDLARLPACADRTLALAEPTGEIWAFRDVARVRARLLGDPVGARGALELGERVLAAEEAQGYRWALLADGWLDAVDDETAARRCLELGVAVARETEEIDGLCSIAERLHRLGDESAAAALVAEAEELDGGGQSAWTVANSWRALGDQARADRVLGDALAGALGTDEALMLAKAFASHGNKSQTSLGLARAEELASEIGDWLSLAEDAASLEADPAVVRRALGRAEAVAVDDEQRQRIATGYHLWLADDAAADRVGPRGLRPEDHRIRVRTLEGWTGSGSALFDWARSRVAPESLARIAGSDYGTDQEAHLAALFDLCGTGLVPRRLPWHPAEVLQLYRWRAGVETDHLARMLCCTILVLADPDDSFDSTGPVLLESALLLGEGGGPRGVAAGLAGGVRSPRRSPGRGRR